jgi:hypothetical protein
MNDNDNYKNNYTRKIAFLVNDHYDKLLYAAGKGKGNRHLGREREGNCIFYQITASERESITIRIRLTAISSQFITLLSSLIQQRRITNEELDPRRSSLVVQEPTPVGD